jgi:hypothetical protein
VKGRVSFSPCDRQVISQTKNTFEGMIEFVSLKTAKTKEKEKKEKEKPKRQGE